MPDVLHFREFGCDVFNEDEERQEVSVVSDSPGLQIEGSPNGGRAIWKIVEARNPPAGGTKDHLVDDGIMASLMITHSSHTGS